MTVGARGLAIDWEAVLADWEPRPIMDRVNSGELPWMTMEAVHRQAPRRLAARHDLTGLTEADIERLVQALVAPRAVARRDPRADLPRSSAT